jgi:hypothetical protein
MFLRNVGYLSTSPNGATTQKTSPPWEPQISKRSTKRFHFLPLHAVSVRCLAWRSAVWFCPKSQMRNGWAFVMAYHVWRTNTAFRLKTRRKAMKIRNLRMHQPVPLTKNQRTIALTTHSSRFVRQYVWAYTQSASAVMTCS